MSLTIKNILCFALFVTSFRSGQSVAGNALEEISDVDLKKLIAQETYVIVLFSTFKTFIALIYF